MTTAKLVADLEQAADAMADRAVSFVMKEPALAQAWLAAAIGTQSACQLLATAIAAEGEAVEREREA